MLARGPGLLRCANLCRMRTRSLFRRTAPALFAAGILAISVARADQKYQVEVYCEDSPVPTVVFAHLVTNRESGTLTKCAGRCAGGMVRIADVLAGFPATVSAAITAQAQAHEAKAAAGNGRSLASCGGTAGSSHDGNSCENNPAMPESVTYSGEIRCDCNADGQDDTSKALESCGLPSGSWPTTFKSRCEDWVLGNSNYGYRTEISIQRQGREYLERLEKVCPALQCQGPYVTCKNTGDSAYQKCVGRKKSSRLRAACEAKRGTAVEKCEKTRDTCFNKIN